MTNKDEESQILIRLGLTTSQARIYLALSQLGQSSITTIAKTAHVDRGETHRVITRLEEKGLVERIIVRPAQFRTISLKDLLSSLIRNRRNEIAQIEREATELISRYPKDRDQTKQERELTVFFPKAGTAAEEIEKNISNVKRSINALTSIATQETVDQTIPSGQDDPWVKALERGIKLTLIMQKPWKENKVPRKVKRYIPYPNFRLWYIPSPPVAEIIIHDEKEVWIKMAGDVFGKTSWILSNNQCIVALARDYFDRILQVSTKSN